MPRPGSSTARGYNHAHRKQRTLLLKHMRDGDPCCRCGQPMFRTQALEADHLGQAVALGGQLPDALAHASCNRSAGARLGNQLRKLRRLGLIPAVPEGKGTASRSW